MRLKGYDYLQNGCYFITICIKNRQCLFGDIVGETMPLGEYGEIAESEILSKQTGAASGALTETRVTIGNVVRGYKSGVSRNARYSSWQRNYYDHIKNNYTPDLAFRKPVMADMQKGQVNPVLSQ